MTSPVILEKKPHKLRHEIKYNINHGEDVILSGRLRKLFQHDKHAGSHGSYRVSSLYFDTPYDKAMKEKLDGVRDREKFRIRYYDENTDFIRLEKKLKTRGLVAKRSARLTRQQTENILDGRFDFLLASEDPLLIEFYSKLTGQLLRPKTIVTYQREAFLYEPGNIRITIDRNLCTGTNWRDFLAPLKIPLDMTEGRTVLEVKYDEFLPDIIRMAVQVSNRHSTAYSKYAIARRYE